MASSDRIPSRVEVVIVGGGIIGVMAGFYLARKGISVAITEKGIIGAEQSGRNLGWCRVLGRDPVEIPFCLESREEWRRLNECMGSETGYRRRETFTLCETDGEMDAAAQWLSSIDSEAVGARMLDRTELERRLAQVPPRFRAALYSAEDGCAEPLLTSAAIARAARGYGAAILQNCAARGVETSANAVSAVVTESGRIACESAIIAGGAWSRLFCGNLGVALPQLKVHSTVLRTGPLAGVPDAMVASSSFGFSPRIDGGYTVSSVAAYAEIVPDSFRLLRAFLPALRGQQGIRLSLGSRFLKEAMVRRRWPLDGCTPFERERILDPTARRDVVLQALREIGSAFPGFREAAVVEIWAGLIDTTPDALPVISAVNAIPGLFLATGFSGHGFGMAPAAGRAVADLCQGQRPSINLQAFSLERFRSDGDISRANSEAEA